MSLSGASTSMRMIFVTLLSSVALSWMSKFFFAQPMNLMPVSSELASNLRKIFRRSLSSKQLNAIQKHFSSQSSSLVNMNNNFDFIMLLKTGEEGSPPATKIAPVLLVRLSLRCIF